MKSVLLAVVAFIMGPAGAQTACSVDVLKTAITNNVLTVAGSVMQCGMDVGLAPTSVPYPTQATAAQLTAMAANPSCQKVYSSVQAGIAGITPVCILTTVPKVITSADIVGISFANYLQLAKGEATTSTPQATTQAPQSTNGTTAPTPTQNTAINTSTPVPTASPTDSSTNSTITTTNNQTTSAPATNVPNADSSTSAPETKPVTSEGIVLASGFGTLLMLAMAIL